MDEVEYFYKDVFYWVDNKKYTDLEFSYYLRASGKIPIRIKCTQ